MKINHISSKENEKIKHLKKLSLKKFRVQFGQFKVENWKTISEAIKQGVLPEQVFVTREFLEKNPQLYNDKLIVFTIDEEINKVFSDLEVVSEICAVFKIEKTKDLNFDEPIIYLNAVNDPGNLGTILRTAVAFGFKNIIVDEKCADIYNFKTLNSAKSAVWQLNILQDKNLQLLNKINESELKIYATSLDNEAVNFEEVNFYKKYCLVFGSEAHGVSDEILKLTHKKVKIQMTDNIESLNVAVSAGVILYNLKIG